MANTLSNLFTIVLSLNGFIDTMREDLPKRYSVGYLVKWYCLLPSQSYHWSHTSGCRIGRRRQLLLPCNSAVRSSACWRVANDLCWIHGIVAVIWWQARIRPTSSAYQTAHCISCGIWHHLYLELVSPVHLCSFSSLLIVSWSISARSTATQSTIKSYLHQSWLQ